MYNGKPVIGLTGSFRPHEWTAQHYLNQSYYHAIRQFGGIPVLIPVLAEKEEMEYLLSTLDGLVLTGGDDIDPALFGETILNDTVQLCPQRDQAEYEALKLVVQRDMPILGICRGVQVMNVFSAAHCTRIFPHRSPAISFTGWKPPTTEPVTAALPRRERPWKAGAPSVSTATITRPSGR